MSPLVQPRSQCCGEEREDLPGLKDPCSAKVLSK